MATKSPKAKAKPKASPLATAEAVQEVMQKLLAEYGRFDTELTYDSPFQLLVAVILSAQCTDARVNMTTPALFAKYPDARALAKAKLPDVEKLIHSCGFFRQKAKSIVRTANDIVDKFAGEVPSAMDDLVTLGGVGRKTASVVMNQAFGLPAIAVDTHVKRVSQRLGWARSEDPVKIEAELCALIPKPLWAQVNGLLILHGRRLCPARKPQCEQCPISNRCEYFQRLRPAL